MEPPPSGPARRRRNGGRIGRPVALPPRIRAEAGRRRGGAAPWRGSALNDPRPLPPPPAPPGGTATAPSPGGRSHTRIADPRRRGRRPHARCAAPDAPARSGAAGTPRRGWPCGWHDPRPSAQSGGNRHRSNLHGGGGSRRLAGGATASAPARRPPVVPRPRATRTGTRPGTPAVPSGRGRSPSPGRTTPRGAQRRPSP